MRGLGRAAGAAPEGIGLVFLAAGRAEVGLAPLLVHRHARGHLAKLFEFLDPEVLVEVDVAVVRRIKELLYHDKLTIDGVIKRLDLESRGETPPETRQAALDLIDRIENEVRGLLELFDSE